MWKSALPERLGSMAGREGPAASAPCPRLTNPCRQLQRQRTATAAARWRKGCTCPLAPLDQLRYHPASVPGRPCSRPSDLVVRRAVTV